MKPSVMVSVAAAGGVLAVGIGGVGAQQPTQGQIVFVPTSHGAVDKVRDEASGQLQIFSCDETDAGLRIQGSIEAATSGLLTVGVGDFDPNAAGIRVSRAYASDAAVVEGAVPDDFVVTLPWADDTASFSLMSGAGERWEASEAVVACPP